MYASPRPTSLCLREEAAVRQYRGDKHEQSGLMRRRLSRNRSRTSSHAISADSRIQKLKRLVGSHQPNCQRTKRTRLPTHLGGQRVRWQRVILASAIDLSTLPHKIFLPKNRPLDLTANSFSSTVFAHAFHPRKRSKMCWPNPAIFSALKSARCSRQQRHLPPERSVD